MWVQGSIIEQYIAACGGQTFESVNGNSVIKTKATNSFEDLTFEWVSTLWPEVLLLSHVSAFEEGFGKYKGFQLPLLQIPNSVDRGIIPAFQVARYDNCG